MIEHSITPTISEFREQIKVLRNVVANLKRAVIVLSAFVVTLLVLFYLV